MGLISDAIQCAQAAKVQSDRPAALPLHIPGGSTTVQVLGAAATTAPPASQLPESVPDSRGASDGAEAIATQPLRLDPGDLSRVDERLVVLRQPAGSKAEEYRGIRTGMLAKWKHKRHLVHTITSALAQEGKTLTCLNLGLSFAELSNHRTIVVEADLRHPQFARLLGTDPQPGLVEVLLDGADASSVVQSFGRTRMDLIVAGRPAADHAFELLSAPAIIELIKDLRRRYDHVIIDTPPVLLSADAGIVGAQSDEVLLVTRLNATPLGLVRQAAQVLNSYNAPVSGVIATNQERRGSTRGGWAGDRQEPQQAVRTQAA